MIQCISPCLYEKDGECTLTHVTSASNTETAFEKNGCAYFKNKKEGELKKSNISYY